MAGGAETIDRKWTLSKKEKGEMVGERENMAVTKGEVHRVWWWLWLWPIKGLTVTGKLIMEAGAAV